MDDGESEMQTAETVVDKIDMEAVSKQEDMLKDPEFISTKIVPKLEYALKNGNGNFEAYHLWE